MPPDLSDWGITRKGHMKKLQDHSSRASALQVTICLILLSISAILFASSFKAAKPPAQDVFYPPLPAQAVPDHVEPEGVPGITVALPIDTINADTVPTTINVIEPITTTQIDGTT